MLDKQEVLKALNAALEHDPRVNRHREAIHIDFEADTLVLAGEVEDIGAKRWAEKLAVRSPNIRQVTDRLRVKPSERRGDGAMRDDLVRGFVNDNSFHVCRIRVWNEAAYATVLSLAEAVNCSMDVVVEDGVVTLAGVVPSPSHKRLALATAWWVRGTRDVVDQLVVEPARDDTDDEVTDAVQIVLAKDPLVHVDQLRVSTASRVVTLEGYVENETERHMAEDDVWYIDYAEDVINRIKVRH